MAADQTLEDRAPRTTSGRTSSTAVKLAQAVALAGMLVPLGSVPAESASITCGFGSGAGGEFCSGESVSSQKFLFGPYSYELTFFDDTEFSDPYSGPAFEITITDVVIDPSFESEFSPFFSESLEGDYECLLISADLNHCVEFQIEAPDPATWGSYTMTIFWDALTPTNASPGSVRVLERPSLDAGDPFVLDMCLVEGSPECVFTFSAVDPAISSGDTDFSTQIPAQLQAVPEPATWLLVSSGLWAAVYRQRRRRPDRS